MKRIFLFLAALFLTSCVGYVQPEALTLDDLPDLEPTKAPVPIPTPVPTEASKDFPSEVPTEEPDYVFECGYTESFGDYVLVVEKRRTNDVDKVLYVLEAYDEVPADAGRSGFLIWGEVIYCISVEEQTELFNLFDDQANNRMEVCTTAVERKFATLKTPNGKMFLVPSYCFLLFPGRTPNLVPEVQA